MVSEEVSGLLPRCHYHMQASPMTATGEEGSNLLPLACFEARQLQPRRPRYVSISSTPPSADR